MPHTFIYLTVILSLFSLTILGTKTDDQHAEPINFPTESYKKSFSRSMSSLSQSQNATEDGCSVPFNFPFHWEEKKPNVPENKSF